MGFPPGYDKPEIEIHLVISVKTGQKKCEICCSLGEEYA
jgi:hypothetical protein